MAPGARGYLPMLVLLSALWGSSYMFIKVAVAEIPPTAMIALRLALAGSVLFAVLALQSGGVRGALEAMRGIGRGALVLGVINSALPFTLIAWGETHIESGIAGIANASVPIFVVLLAIRFNPAERAAGWRLAGVMVGIVGVGVLAGLHPSGGWWAVAGVAAITLASLCYAAANLYAQHHYGRVNVIALAAGTHCAAALMILPFGLARLPPHAPSWKALGSVLALAVLGTAVASLVHYRMVTWYGSARTTMVTYLIPAFALFYGVVILDEPLTVNAILGLALILTGVALGSGLVRVRRREPLPASPAP
jgi:drug/metabolite transporter (DMT)-like permease